MRPPEHDATWVGLSAEPLPAGDALEWAIRPSCGAVVLFAGTVRDHAPGRPDVTRLDYEAYEEQVEPALARVAAALRERWPMVGRVALLHRVGSLDVGEIAVVVAVSSPHRPEAFVAGRYAIDALKATAPIWKREVWPGGASWVRCDHEVLSA